MHYRSHDNPTLPPTRPIGVFVAIFGLVVVAIGMIALLKYR